MVFSLSLHGLICLILKQPYKVGTLPIVLQMKKERLCEVKFALSHIASKQHSWDLNLIYNSSEISTMLKTLLLNWGAETPV